MPNFILLYTKSRIFFHALHESVERKWQQMDYSANQLAKNKLIILYLIQKMSMALSNSEICQFALEKNYMDYFSVQQYISELVEAHLLKQNKYKNDTRYTLTQKGKDIINYFISHMAENIKNEIDFYVQQNKKRIHTESEVTAHYILQPNNDYVVKCALCDSDGINLMEISFNVATLQQAKLICDNWKNNVSRIYGTILNTFISQ